MIGAEFVHRIWGSSSFLSRIASSLSSSVCFPKLMFPDYSGQKNRSFSCFTWSSIRLKAVINRNYSLCYSLISHIKSSESASFCRGLWGFGEGVSFVFFPPRFHVICRKVSLVYAFTTFSLTSSLPATLAFLPFSLPAPFYLKILVFFPFIVSFFSMALTNF